MKLCRLFPVAGTLLAFWGCPAQCGSAFKELTGRAGIAAELGPHPLIVVHASTEFDWESSAAARMESVIARFKASGRPVVYLVHDQTPEGYVRWYPKDRRPDYEIFSEGGEHNLPLSGNEVTIVGGYFGSYDGARGCHTLAVRDAVRMHFGRSNSPLTVHMPLPAIFFWNQDESVRERLLGQEHGLDDPFNCRRRQLGTPT